MLARGCVHFVHDRWGEGRQLIRGLIAQAKKDWLEFRRDRLSVALALLLPVASLLLFGFGIRLESKDIPTAVVDRDGTTQSRGFAQRLYASEAFNPAPAQDPGSDPIMRGGAHAVVYIPHGFEATINRGQVADILFAIDGTALTEAHATAPMAEAFGTIFSTYIKPPDPRLFYVVPRIVAWFNPGLEESLFIVSGVFGVVLWMFPSLLSAVSMSRDFENRTVVQPFSANLSPVSFLLGKLSVYLAVGICQAILIVALGCAIFDLHFVDQGIKFPLCAVIYLVVSVLFGMLIGLLTNSQTTAVQAISSGGFFPCLLLSGYVYPLSNIPFPLSLISYLVPARYFIHVSRDTFIRGAGWEVIGPDLIALTIFAMVLFALCWLRVKDMRLRD